MASDGFPSISFFLSIILDIYSNHAFRPFDKEIDAIWFECHVSLGVFICCLQIQVDSLWCQCMTTKPAFEVSNFSRGGGIVRECNFPNCFKILAIITYGRNDIVSTLMKDHAVRDFIWEILLINTCAALLLQLYR